MRSTPLLLASCIQGAKQGEHLEKFSVNPVLNQHSGMKYKNVCRSPLWTEFNITCSTLRKMNSKHFKPELTFKFFCEVSSTSESDVREKWYAFKNSIVQLPGQI